MTDKSESDSPVTSPETPVPGVFPPAERPFQSHQPYSVVDRRRVQPEGESEGLPVGPGDVVVSIANGTEIRAAYPGHDSTTALTGFRAVVDVEGFVDGHFQVIVAEGSRRGQRFEVPRAGLEAGVIDEGETEHDVVGKLELFVQLYADGSTTHALGPRMKGPEARIAEQEGRTPLVEVIHNGPDDGAGYSTFEEASAAQAAAEAPPTMPRRKFTLAELHDIAVASGRDEEAVIAAARANDMLATEEETAAGQKIETDRREIERQTRQTAILAGQRKARALVAPAVRAVHPDLLIVRVLHLELVTESGLALAKEAKELPTMALVMFAGDGAVAMFPGLTAGDTVLFSKYGGVDLLLPEGDFRVLHKDELLAVLDTP